MSTVQGEVKRMEDLSYLTTWWYCGIPQEGDLMFWFLYMILWYPPRGQLDVLVPLHDTVVSPRGQLDVLVPLHDTVVSPQKATRCSGSSTWYCGIPQRATWCSGSSTWYCGIPSEGDLVFWFLYMILWYPPRRRLGVLDKTLSLPLMGLPELGIPQYVSNYVRCNSYFVMFIYLQTDLLGKLLNRSGSVPTWTWTHVWHGPYSYRGHGKGIWWPLQVRY